MLSGLVLNRLEASDINEVYLNSLNDKSHMKYSRNRFFDHTKQTQEDYLRQFDQVNKLIFSLKDQELGIFVGVINCDVNYDSLTINLGFLIFKEYSNQGYGLKAVKLIKEYLSSQFPGMTLLIGTEKANLAMQRVAIAAKFVPVSQHLEDVDEVINFSYAMSNFDNQMVACVPDIIQNANKIGVVAHDAGGAEQISWLLKNVKDSITIFAAGPAIKILKSQNKSSVFVSDLNLLDDSDLIITGSGWMTDFEVKALAYARDKGILAITLIDHWVNYSERFRGEATSLLQVVAVTNKDALDLALNCFPKKLVLLLPDFQLEYYRKHVFEAERQKDTILVVLEPISTHTNEFMISQQTRDQLYEFAIENRSVATDRIIIRPHPSETDIILFELDSRFNENLFEISKNRTLLEDLLTAKVVLGMSSYALYLAHMSGVPTYSLFAGNSRHWTSKFPGILGF
jgi:RimJ/RimL family protein N-acetyltransferase